jgi:hypothetical protein
MMDDELENESDNEEEEEVEKVEEGEEEVEESEKGEEGEESEGPYSASDDDDAEDMNFDAPQWSWCGYTVDDDEFESDFCELMVLALSAGERLTLEGCQCLLTQIGDCAALDAHPVLNHHNVVDKQLLLNACKLTDAGLRYVAKVATSTAPGRLPEAVVALAAIRSLEHIAHPYESYMALRVLDCLLQHPRQPGLSSQQRLIAQLCVELGAVKRVREQWDCESTLLDNAVYNATDEDEQTRASLRRLVTRSEDLCIHILGALLSCSPVAATLKGLHWVGYGCSLIAGPLPDRCLSLIAAGVRRAHIDFLDEGNPAVGFYTEGRIPKAVTNFAFYTTAPDDDSPDGCVVLDSNVVQRLMAVRGFVWIIAYLAEDKLLATKLLAGYGTSFSFGGGLFANTLEAILSWASTCESGLAPAERQLCLYVQGACEDALVRPCLQ